MQLGPSEPTKRPRPRQRVSTSCTECRRRKQKCNQAKDRPCNNCARRFPPVVCRYDSDGQSPPGMDGIMEFEVADSPLDAGEASGSSPYYSGYGVAGQDYMYTAENQLAQNIPSSYSTSMATYSTALGSPAAYVPSQGDGYALDSSSFIQGTRANDVQYYSTSYAAPGRGQSYAGAVPYHICELDYGAPICSTCQATASQQPGNQWPPTSQ